MHINHLEHFWYNCRDCCNYCMVYDKHCRIPRFRIPQILPKVHVSLENNDLWSKFHSLTTEMIITKSGRQMFPRLEVYLTGLNPFSKYYIYLELRMSSDKAYKYVKDASNPESGRWIENGTANKTNHVYNSGVFYSSNAKFGSVLMNEMLSFKELKISNNPTICVNSSNVLLQSRHKYLPRLWILKANEFDFETESPFNLFYLMHNCDKTFFDLDQTEFMAVTAYQNERITQLKVNYNPLAKGFREESKLKRKLKNAANTESHSTEKKPKMAEPNTTPFFRPWSA